MRHWLRVCGLLVVVLALAVALGLSLSCASPTPSSAEDPNVYYEHGVLVHKMNNGDVCYIYPGIGALSCVAHS